MHAGAANAGVPLAKIVQTYGWNAYFMSLAGACGIILLLLAPMTNLKSYSSARPSWRPRPPEIGTARELLYCRGQGNVAGTRAGGRFSGQ